jgi:hypothetical protein
MEVLVALLLMGLVGLTTLQVFGAGLRLARASGDHVGATLLATTKLAEVDATGLEPETAEGVEDGYRWTRRVTLEPNLLPFDAASPEAARVRLARIAVEVTWGRSRRVELVTLRTWSARL